MFLMLVATGLLLGLFFLTSLYFQHVLGFSALKTGLVFLPVAIAITAGAQTAAHLPGARSLGDADDDDRRGGPVANAIRQHDQGDQRIFEWATGNPLHARFRASALPEYRASLRYVAPVGQGASDVASASVPPTAPFLESSSGLARRASCPATLVVATRAASEGRVVRSRRGQLGVG
jgi:hypothetical protein